MTIVQTADGCCESTVAIQKANNLHLKNCKPQFVRFHTEEIEALPMPPLILLALL
jgi:hypothetical protein